MADDVVVDRGKSQLSDLWTKEDYWAIWLGFVIIIVSLGVYLNSPIRGEIESKIAAANAIQEQEVQAAPLKTIAWYKADDEKKSLKASSSPFGKFVAHWTKHPGGWTSNPLDSFIKTEAQAKEASEKAKPKYEEAKAKADAALAAATQAEEAARAANFKDTALNDAAKSAIAAWREAAKTAKEAKSKTDVKPFNLLPNLVGLAVFLAAFFSIGTFFMGKSVPRFIVGFMLVFVTAVLAYMLGGQAVFKQYGFGAEAWAVVLGLILANTVGTPSWAKQGCEVEYFIKTGLVLLGGEVLFNKIVAIGIPGIFVAWVVTPIVLVVTFIFGQKVLKMPSPTLNIVISADMSVCGTSAAIATAAACRAKKEELTLSIGLSLVFTAIMMIAMPAFIKAVGIPEVLGGAWIGGTIDSTGAVAAAGAFLGPKAMYVAATIKMIQNVLIGVTAFGVAVYWCTKMECREGERVGLDEIWHRFPKFVLGFLAASIVISTISGSLGGELASALIDNGVVAGGTKPIRDWAFTLAFAAIGLSTNFRELAHYFKGGKPVILYVCGQSFNLALTLAMAYVMFYVVFPEITAKI